MSSTPIDNIPDPAFYTYPSGNLPAGLTQPSTSSSSSSSSTSSTSSSTGSTSTESPYVQQYDALQLYDQQELFNVSFGSQQNAALNIDSVLAQWAAIDAADKEAQAQQIQTLLNNDATSSTDANANLPTLDELESQSDQQAQTALNNYSSAPTGSSIVDFQA